MKEIDRVTNINRNAITALSDTELQQFHAKHRKTYCTCRGIEKTIREKSLTDLAEAEMSRRGVSRIPYFRGRFNGQPDASLTYDEHITQELAQVIEEQQNVFLNAEAGLYNRCSRDEIYGWNPIPADWITEAQDSIA